MAKLKKLNIPSRTENWNPRLSGGITLCCNQLQQTHSWVDRQWEHSTFSLTLTVKVNTFFI